MNPNEQTRPQIGQQARSTAKDFFLHLAGIVTLYISAISFINLIFDIINTLFPDQLSYYIIGYSAGMRLEIAALIIMVPLYLLFTWLIRKDIKRNPSKAELGIRKWLTYLTLFLAGLTLAIDLITLIMFFLNGEITARFVLKVIALLIVAAAIFVFYLLDIRKDSAASANWKLPKIAAWIIALVVLISIIGAFFIVGSPFTERQRRFDTQRLSDLQNIQSQVVSYWQQKSALPATLSDLNDSLSYNMIPIDPETNLPYQYKTTGARSFQICATFDLTSAQNPQYQPGYPYNTNVPIAPKGVDNSTSTIDNWQHAAGNVCFDRTIDPQQYPPIPKPL